MDIKKFMKYMKQFKKENPDQIIIVETPDYHVRMRLGDVIFFEGLLDEVVFYNE